MNETTAERVAFVLGEVISVAKEMNPDIDAYMARNDKGEFSLHIEDNDGTYEVKV